MIVVTGTKRSGTSMWMQALSAAGLEVIGEAFPHRWQSTLAAANPRGFFESSFRSGVHHRTNPDPRSGRYLSAEETEWTATKIFVRGLVRTERAYLRSVIAGVRPWRAYAASIRRLRRIEVESAGGDRAKAARMPSIPEHLEWWDDNVTLLRDATVRGYPMLWVGYDDVIASPRGEVARVLGFVGRGDVDAACAAIEPSLRTSFESVEPVQGDAAALDLLEAGLLGGEATHPSFVAAVSALDRRMRPQIARFRKADAEARRTHRRPRARLPRLAGTP
jgi:hypothetical protein